MISGLLVGQANHQVPQDGLGDVPLLDGDLTPRTERREPPSREPAT